MIETPNKIAFRFPSAFVLLCFVKKLTVIGIIGNTQGVNSAAKPPTNANRKIDQRPFFSSTGADTFLKALLSLATKVCSVVTESLACFTESLGVVPSVKATEVSPAADSSNFNSGN